MTQIEASGSEKPPIRRPSRVRTGAASAGTVNIAAGEDKMDTSDGSDSSGSCEIQNWGSIGGYEPREDSAREVTLRGTRKRRHHSAEIRKRPCKRSRPSSEAGAAPPKFFLDVGYGDEEYAERDDSSG